MAAYTNQCLLLCMFNGFILSSWEFFSLFEYVITHKYVCNVYLSFFFCYITYSSFTYCSFKAPHYPHFSVSFIALTLYFQGHTSHCVQISQVQTFIPSSVHWIHRNYIVQSATDPVTSNITYFPLNFSCCSGESVSGVGHCNCSCHA